MELPEDLKNNVENMALVIDNIYKRNPPNDRLKVAVAQLVTLPEPTKTFYLKVCGALSSWNSIFKGCICHPSYIEKGGITELYNDLKAVCAKLDFNYTLAKDFIVMHGTPDRNGKTWTMDSGEEIKNPIAIFTNWCKKFQRNKGAIHVK